MHEDLRYFSFIDHASPFELEALGISYCAGGEYRIRRGSESTRFVFEYIISGRGLLEIDGQRFEPEKGDAYIIEAGKRHEYSSSTDDPWIKIWFNAFGSLPACLLSSYGLRGVYFFKRPGEELQSVFETWRARILRNAWDADSLGAAAITEIVSLLAARRKHASCCDASFKLKRLLDSELSRNFTIGEMATHAGLSTTHMNRLFRRDFGVSPYKYHLERKMENAKMLLRGSRLRVREIASSLGFKDEYYFSNLFKRKTGLSPLAYRRTGV